MKKHLKYWSLTLCKLSGEDVAIIAQCNRRIRHKFALIGTFVLILLVCCLLSAIYFVDHMFHNTFLDIAIGIIWASIVTNMYVLLLYTITPTLLPVRERKKKNSPYQNFNFSSSMILRIFMMVLLAIITAQPLNVLLLGSADILFVENIRLLLEDNIYSHLLTLGVIFIFTLPILLKYRIRKLEEFYKTKASINKRLVSDNYQEFKQEYKRILESKLENYNRQIQRRLSLHINLLENKIGTSPTQILLEIDEELAYMSINKYEYWADPPYRTQRHMVSGNNKTEQDLLKFIYPD